MSNIRLGDTVRLKGKTTEAKVIYLQYPQVGNATRAVNGDKVRVTLGRPLGGFRTHPHGALELVRAEGC